ncbi:hypothetical protein ACOMHN_020408 [Nucella lapillus]
MIILKGSALTLGIPCVPVIKPDGSIRVCADYYGTVNRFCEVDQYPIPTLEDMLDKVAAELLMSRQPCIRFAVLRASQTQQQVRLFEKNMNSIPDFTVGQPVFALNFGKGSKWIPGTIIKVLSPRNFDVQVGDVMWKRHQDQLWPRQIPMNTLQQ